MNTYEPSPSAITTSDNSISSELLERALGDAVATKRMLKTGYVRQFGGLYPTECDTVAAHSHTVSVLAVTLASEVRSAIKKMFGTDLDMEEVALMSIFHDHGEGRSQDPGAISHAIGSCDARGMERLGLEASVKGFQIESRAMRLYDDYRHYRTLTSVLVHMADTLEGIEKALHSGAGGRSPEIVSDAVRSAQGAVQSYLRRKTESAETKFLVEQILIPGLQVIADRYGVDLLDMAQLATPQS